MISPSKLTTESESEASEGSEGVSEGGMTRDIYTTIATHNYPYNIHNYAHYS